VKIIVFGGPGEGSLGERIAGGVSDCISFSGKTDLREAMALIGRCTLFITNDSGLMHVAAALDRPLIAIFGSTDHITTGPYGSNSRIVRMPMPCSPCMKPECPEDHQCMKRISVEMVYEAAEEFL
jgi:heptosyltransferase-2